MDWNNITAFCFTYALDGGAWLRDRDGNSSWESCSTISRMMGEGWFAKMRTKQGWMTGCWVNV